MVYSNVVDYVLLPETKANFLESGMIFVALRYLFKISFPRGNYLYRLATSAGVFR